METAGGISIEVVADRLDRLEERVGELAEVMAPAREPYLTISQAAKLLKVSRRTIYNWLEAGKLTVRRTPAGVPRIREKDLWRD